MPALMTVMPPITKERARVPAGVPAGGRFAEQKRSDSDVNLTSWDEIELGTGRTRIGSRAAIEISAHHARSRNFKTPLRNLPWEDIAQEALASVRTSVKNGRAEAFTPGLISAAVSQKVAAAINTQQQIRHEDAKATGMLREVVDAEERLLGRSLTFREVDDLARRIRDSWEAPRHRPQRDFHHRFIELSIDSMSEARFRELSEHVEPAAYVDEGSSASELATDVELGLVSKATARGRAWDSLADIWDVPRVSQVNSKTDIDNHRKVIEFHGGVGAVVDSYLRDRVLTPQARAVFAPYGKLSADDRAAIANIFATRRTVAERLWASASAGSVKPRPKWNERAFS